MKWLKSPGKLTVLLLVLLLAGAGGIYMAARDSGKEAGRSAATSDGVECGDRKCFQGKFAACQPARFTQQPSHRDAPTMYFEILSGKKGDCRMLFKDSEQNLGLECAYKNISADFDVAVYQKMNQIGLKKDKNHGCGGPLVAELQKKPGR